MDVSIAEESVLAIIFLKINRQIKSHQKIPSFEQKEGIFLLIFFSFRCKIYCDLGFERCLFPSLLWNHFIRGIGEFSLFFRLRGILIT